MLTPSTQIPKDKIRDIIFALGEHNMLGFGPGSGYSAFNTREVWSNILNLLFSCTNKFCCLVLLFLTWMAWFLFACLVYNWSGLLKKAWQQIQKMVWCGVLLLRQQQHITMAGEQPELNVWHLKAGPVEFICQSVWKKIEHWIIWSDQNTTFKSQENHNHMKKFTGCSF